MNDHDILERDLGPTSLSLLVRVRGGEEQAWTKLVHLYGPLVYAWCRRWGLSPPDAADVGQEVFCAVWSSLDGFRRERPGDSFRAWLRVVARNKTNDFWRRQCQQEQSAGGSRAWQYLEASCEPPDEAEISRETTQLYRRAVELLTTDFEPATVAAFWRTVVEGQPAREAAQSLGLSLNAVYIAKSRVLARLREELAGL